MDSAPPYTALAPVETTPSDYIRLKESIVQPLPEHKFVGLLACQRTSLVVHLTPRALLGVSQSKRDLVDSKTDPRDTIYGCSLSNPTLLSRRFRFLP